MSGRRIIHLLGIACAAALLGVSGRIAIRTWPRPMHLVTEPFPSVRFERGNMIVPLRTKSLLAEVGRFDDELSAYLWFDYLRSRPGVEGSQVLLTVTEKEQAPVYRIEVVLPNDALSESSLRSWSPGCGRVRQKHTGTRHSGERTSCGRYP